MRAIFNHVDKTSMVNKGFIYMKKEPYFLGDTEGNPENTLLYG